MVRRADTGARQPGMLTEEEWQAAIRAYQEAKERASRALRGYTATGPYQAAADPFSGAPISTEGAQPTMRGQLARREYEQALTDVRRIEAANPWVREAETWTGQGLENYQMRYHEQQARRTGQMPNLEQIAQEGERLRAYMAPARGAPALGQAQAAPAQAETPPWRQPGMTPEEEQYARAQYYGMPTPEEREQQTWQQRMWQAQLAEMEGAGQQAQFGRQQQLWENAWAEQQAARQQAQFAQSSWQDVLPWAAAPGVEYAPGFEPGGMIAQEFARRGTPFNPEAFRPAPWRAPQQVGGVGQSSQLAALNMVLLQMAQRLGG